jgi:hypothetical protein
MTDITYPADAGADLYLLTVMGTPTTGSVTETRDLHNATVGNPDGVAGAKALGDLSHNVYLPSDGTNRLLFLDTWNTPTGVGQFFSDEQVLQGAAALFAEREAVLWMPAAGFGSYNLQVPSGKTVAGIGIMRAPVADYEVAGKAFHADSVAKINAGRQFGLIAHTLWVPLPVPGTKPATEVFGVDYWLDADQMDKWYASASYDTVGAAFTGAPESSTLRPAGSGWIEW